MHFWEYKIITGYHTDLITLEDKMIEAGRQGYEVVTILTDRIASTFTVFMKRKLG